MWFARFPGSHAFEGRRYLAFPPAPPPPRRPVPSLPSGAEPSRFASRLPIVFLACSVPDPSGQSRSEEYRRDRKRFRPCLILLRLSALLPPWLDLDRPQKKPRHPALSKRAAIP